MGNLEVHLPVPRSTGQSGLKYPLVLTSRPGLSVNFTNFGTPITLGRPSLTPTCSRLPGPDGVHLSKFTTVTRDFRGVGRENPLYSASGAVDPVELVVEQVSLKWNRREV